MISKLKVCLIGATGVGKTSLATRYLHSIFSETYRTTIGVTIETIEVRHRERVVQLVIWDISGEDEFQSVQPSYVSGAAGYLLVVDGTRRDTVDIGLTLATRMRATVGNVPFVVVVNKADLTASWEVGPDELRPLAERAHAVVQTSARTGAGVAETFERLVEGIFERLEPRQESKWT